MVSNTEITEFLIEHIAQRAEINEFCQREFKKNLLQIVGIDTNNPPKAEDMPCLVYEPIIKQVGSMQTAYDYEFHLKLFILGDEMPSISDDVARFSGIYQIETLGGLILQAVSRAIDCKSNAEAYNIDFYHDQIDIAPIYSGSIVLNFSIPQVIGGELSFRS